MKSLVSASALAIASMSLLLSSCATQEEMAPKPAPAPVPAAKAEAKAPAEKAAEKAPEKAKATKLAGDVGLLDTEKNYMILVTKEGKLVTIDFDPKFQPTQSEPVPSKVADIGLGSSAVVQYVKEGDKLIATNIEYVPAKGE
ncbi:MAG TPA: hypothetical protein VNN13_13300 [Methylomirabilota bacterium]|nr:hypothetical protein [Methylomirabilota bacterium]